MPFTLPSSMTVRTRAFLRTVVPAARRATRSKFLVGKSHVVPFEGRGARLPALQFDPPGYHGEAGVGSRAKKGPARKYLRPKNRC